MVQDAKNFLETLPINIPPNHIKKRRTKDKKDKADKERPQVMCQSLKGADVCSVLSNSLSVCAHSTKYGKVAIRTAINATQKAIADLRNSLHFKAEPILLRRKNSSRQISFTQSIERDFSDKTKFVRITIQVLHKMAPLSIILLIYSAWKYLQNYIIDIKFDNSYITRETLLLDDRRRTVGAETLLPLKRHERRFVADTTSTSDLTCEEETLYSTGICVFFLHVLISFVTYMFDYVLYWILSMISESAGSVASRGVKSQDVLMGEGALFDLLNRFISSFHSTENSAYALAVDSSKCVPKASEPKLLYLFILFLLYIAVILTIVFKAYIFRFRLKLAAYFYPERQKVRSAYLYTKLLNWRRKADSSLSTKVREEQRKRNLSQEIGLCKRLSRACPVFKAFSLDSRRCLACGQLEDRRYIDCNTPDCCGLYCEECFRDMSNKCPLCERCFVPVRRDLTDEEEMMVLRADKVYL